MTLLTPTLKTTSKATASAKQRVPATTKTEDRSGQTQQPTASVIKTVLVASYGWPTDEMQPSKRQAARR